jgi:hypothetical protein
LARGPLEGLEPFGVVRSAQALPPLRQPVGRPTAAETERRAVREHRQTLCSASTDARPLGLVDASKFTAAGEPIFVANDGDEGKEAVVRAYGVEPDAPSVESEFAFDYTPAEFSFPAMPNVPGRATIAELSIIIDNISLDQKGSPRCAGVPGVFQNSGKTASRFAMSAARSCTGPLLKSKAAPHLTPFWGPCGARC